MDVLTSGHEQVVFCADPESGLRAVIAVYSTALGPALGGTRFFPYASEEAAVADALALSRAMAYKNSLAGLDLGGGKGVIIGDPSVHKTEALLRAYGRFVESLGGRYLTACDVGTSNADLDVVARETRFAHGRSLAQGGCGDSSVLTAFGVFQGMRAAAEHRWGSASLAGRTVAVAGVGKVGSWLVDSLVDDGASVVVTDVDPAAVQRVQAQHPGVRAATDTAELVRTPHDVYAPCALGGALDDETVAVLPARDRLRRRQQPAGPRRDRAAAGRPRHPVRAGLPGERRRGHPGRGRAARFLLRPGRGEGDRDPRRGPAGVRRRRRRRGLPRGRRRPARRGADALGRSVGDHPVAPPGMRSRSRRAVLTCPSGGRAGRTCAEPRSVT